MQRLPFDATLEQYDRQAVDLIDAWRAGDRDAAELFKHNHPRFLRSDVPWLPKDLADADLRAAGLELDDARLALARWYNFGGWPALASFAESVRDRQSAAYRFESAVEAVIDGDMTTLTSALRADPDLVRARSTRVMSYEPPHRSTLLHYVAANGVEGYRQRTPPNAVDVAKLLLTSGAEVDALADLYGGQWTTMGLLVSSGHPAEAGLQVALVDTLADFGADVDRRMGGDWASNLLTALAFGYRDTAEALVRRGARADSLAAVAGLGWVDQVRELLPAADAKERHRALALAALHGHADIVKALLDAGEDPNRYNPRGNHAHSTPLHQAALAGHDAAVRVLVEHGASVEIEDTIYHANAVGWAHHGGHPEIETYLRAHRKSWNAKDAEDAKESEY